MKNSPNRWSSICSKKTSKATWGFIAFQMSLFPMVMSTVVPKDLSRALPLGFQSAIFVSSGWHTGVRAPLCRDWLGEIPGRGPCYEGGSH